MLKGAELADVPVPVLTIDPVSAAWNNKGKRYSQKYVRIERRFP